MQNKIFLQLHYIGDIFTVYIQAIHLAHYKQNILKIIFYK